MYCSTVLLLETLFENLKWGVIRKAVPHDNFCTWLKTGRGCFCRSDRSGFETLFQRNCKRKWEVNSYFNICYVVEIVVKQRCDAQSEKFFFSKSRGVKLHKCLKSYWDRSVFSHRQTVSAVHSSDSITAAPLFFFFFFSYLSLFQYLRASLQCSLGFRVQGKLTLEDLKPNRLSWLPTSVFLILNAPSFSGDFDLKCAVDTNFTLKQVLCTFLLHLRRNFLKVCLLLIKRLRNTVFNVS